MNTIFKYVSHFRKCPHDFLKKPKVLRKEGEVETNALLLDVLRELDRDIIQQTSLLDHIKLKSFSENHLIAMQLAAWFFSFDIFKSLSIKVSKINSFLINDLKDLSMYISPKEWLQDEDRSEEFVRTALMACEIIPRGESIEEAMDRLDALSTLKRNNVLSRSTKAYDRIIQIRKKMAEKKAREAANVYGRE